MAASYPVSKPPPSARLEIRVQYTCHDYALASWGQVLMVVWRHETRTQGVLALAACTRDFAARHPRGIFLLTIVQAGAPAPGAAARAELARFLGSSTFIRGSAVVVEGSGFRAAFVRGVVTGLTLLARQPFPHQVCTLEEACELFECEGRRSGVAFDPSAFVPGITALRERIERQLDGS